MNVHNHLIYRGSVQSPSAAVLTLLYHGSADAIIEAPLAAQMLAPSAHVIVRAAYTGRLGARELELDADVVLTCSGSPNASPPPSSAFNCGVAREVPAADRHCGWAFVASALGASLAFSRRRRRARLRARRVACS